MAGTTCYVHIDDLPDIILSNIFSLISDTRTRNAMSLVCRKWHSLERSTRTSIALRGNIKDLFLVPTCFWAVTDIDLSLLSPWGNPLLDYSPKSILSANLLSKAFPSVISLTVCVRNPSILHLLAPQWPNLRYVKLVRWHQRLSAPLGSDIIPLLEHCHSLSSLDLSNFYCWTEDLPPTLKAHPWVSASLTHLNMLNHSLFEGFKSHELLAITASCPNLSQLLALCLFDHRYIDFVGDETLLALASNCPSLSLLHLADISSLSGARRPRPDLDDVGYTSEDANFRITMLEDIFASLPLLEELVLDVCENVKSTWPALELLNATCSRLKSLKLGHFLGICREVDSWPDGVSLCKGLESLSIKNSDDLTDSCLIAISLGCPKLVKFEVEGCKKITAMGIRKLACVLQQTLVEVKISCCKHLNTKRSIWALEPVQKHIRKLHLDCVWESIQPSQGNASNSYQFAGIPKLGRGKRNVIPEETSLKKKDEYLDTNCPKIGGNSKEFFKRSWARLQHLSLWIPVGDLLNPLSSVGLENCPVLEEIQIRVEGDCRNQRRPSVCAFGLSTLACYPQLSKMHLDCSGAIGYALTAPYGHIDLSIWERFFLYGIGNLNLSELNYWPPQDKDFNQRSLSLPAAALLADCTSLRRLFIHGTVNEHFMMFLLKIPNLRDVQLRGDYHPAPDYDTTTELRADSCRRFEDALNSRHIQD
ncbi:F-box/LRR-repeat MAX2 homolog A-like [Cornus florida]|uniref:F-box/LRR-repeat MAX2 homolog A-like n=1 Tax=Cornus florida TaxID=4283 RepID=UPI00289D52DE|nr:F-box/LRR-repeat MAX2 homolog A-like [Cornus florida]